MADYSPTIIAASLDDNELKTSIDKLVKYVGDQSLKMAQEFDAGVQLMKESLKNLGNIKQLDSNSRAKSHDDAAKAIERETNALDNLAKATSRATGRKDIRHDYVQLDSDIDKQWSYIIDLNKDVDAQLQHMIEHEQKLIQEKEREAQVTREIQEARDTRVGVSGKSLGWEAVNTAGKKAREMASGAKEVNYLRQQVASLLEVEEREIRVANTTTSSYSQLNQYVKQLQASYQRLGADRIAKGEGTDIVNEIQKVQRAMAQLNAQMSRPINWDAVKNLPTQTLDDIAYKIQMLQRYRSGLNVETQTKEIKDVNNAIDELNKKQNHLINTNKGLLESNNALARSWNYMKNRLAFYFTVGASTAFVKNLIDVRSQYEMNEKALGILINSAERGTQIFKELSEMALVSPYTLIELSSATKQLVAYGVAAKDVVDTTRRLADMAAAVGIPMERLTYALGQIKAYGYLNSRDQRMFANAGIPLVQELAKHYTELEGKLVSTADVYDRIKKKSVEYADVVQVINKMTDQGGKFFDYQAKMADTMKVQLANLTLAWNNMLNEIGSDWQGFITSGIKGLKQLFLAWKSVNKAIEDMAMTFGVVKILQYITVLSGLGTKFELLGKFVGNSAKQLGGFANSAKSLFSSLSAVASNPITWVAAVVYALTSIIHHIHNVSAAAKEMNREIAKNAQEAANSLEKYLSTEGAKSTRASAKAGKLGSVDATKAFEDLREQIELSSDSANELIAPLLKINDANERLTAAFDLADKIEIATRKLSGLNEEAFKVSQDGWLNGLFGEGLAEDVEDYVNYAFGKGWQLYKGQSQAEAEREMELLAKDMAQVLKDRLGADINDPTILGEAVERLRKAIKDKNPQIKGEVAQWFDVKLDQLLSEQFKSAYDKNRSINQQFLTILKRDYASAFSDVTKDILGDTATWGEAQEDAIRKAAAELKKTTLPMWHSTIDQMVAYMNSKDWRIRIATEMNIASLSDLQQEWQNRMSLLPKDVQDALNPYKPKSGETLSKWADDQRQSIQGLNKDIKAYEADASSFSKTQIENLKTEKLAREEALRVFKQPTATKEDVKAQKQASSELQKALKEELSLIDKVRSDYKKLTKDGIDSVTALNTATSGFDETLSYINAVLGRYGVGRLDLTKYAGVSNPTAIMTLLQSQLDALQNSSLVKPAEIKDLQVKLKDLKVDSLTFNQETIIKSLDNELGKIKDEYEIAVELDASPELGSAFAEAFDISTSDFPHTIEDVINRAQNAINNALLDNGYSKFFDILKGNTESLRESMGQSVDSNFIDAIEKAQKAVRDLWKKDAQETISGWDKLLEKYAEYEYKRKKIMEDAEKEMQLARKRGAGDDVLNAINLRKRRELAKLDFEQFQQSPTWIAATGDLATMTNGAIGLLIDRLEEYKKKAKNLDPKQIKQINNALKQLHRQQRQNNPFAFIANAIDEAKNRVEDYQLQINEAEERLTQLNKKRAEGVKLTEAEESEYANLTFSITKWREEMQEAGKVSAVSIVKGLQDMLSQINQVTSGIGEMFAAFGDEEAQKKIQKVTSTIEKGLSFAALGASIGGKSAGGWGAAIGGVVGLLVGGLTAFSDEISGNASITKRIESSERAVKRLQNAYIDLEQAVEDAYGTEEYYAIRVAQANKEAQLAELKRQKRLEGSRSSKHRDQDKILDLDRQIIELQNDIDDSLKNIVNDFMGISSVGDAIEDMVSNIIDALRNGEDAMQAFNENIDDMIANMIKKVYSEKLLGNWFNELWQDVETDIEGRTAPYREQLAQYKDIRARILSGEYLLYGVDGKMYAGLSGYSAVNEKIAELEELLRNASQITVSDVEKFAGMATEGESYIEEQIKQMDELLQRLGLMKDGNTKTLSNLQQGIQSITENTAGALEAYMNGVSQQVYLHSTLLTEIRDAVVGFNMDVQLGVQSQILLELQNSYQVQMAIQGILQGWSSANGLAVRVEMIE